MYGQPFDHVFYVSYLTYNNMGENSPEPHPDGDPLEQMMKEALAPRSTFSEFCEETTLNGWYYLAKRGVGRISRSYWSLAVLASIGLALFFCYGATTEWLDSDVIITVDSVTASLDKVAFPGLTVCNQNQVIRFTRLLHSWVGLID